MTALEKLIEELPPDLRQEVEDFARFLLISRANAQKTSRRQKRLRLSWAGALSEYRHRFTSIELQKKSLEWWGI
ncbi:MAG TPA: DUF2281 domain-containing protein [Anaerolineales bacterium]|nr:DUF2281 domain-containing protein [Anaerolineales bacterium]